MRRNRKKEIDQFAKISIIGHFAFKKHFANGQTIKTKIITEELCGIFGENQVLKIDTHGSKLISILKAPLQARKAISKSKNVILFPAQNGLRVFAPILLLFKNFFKNSKLHYVVIGGWLPEFLKNHRTLRDSLKRFDCIYVETLSMKNALENIGFQNVFVLPNCKKLKILNEAELVYSNSEPLKLCTFSRVMKEKGIEDAANAVIEVNRRFNRTALTLDIFGQVDVQQQNWFDDLKASFPAFVNYKGIIPFDQSTDTLKQYFVLLFPTHYTGEGFAGTLIDAMAAGVPVIASDWKYNSEFVREEKNGFLYPTFDQEKLIDKLIWAVENPSQINLLKANCVKLAQCYLPSNVIQILITQLN